MIHKLSEKMPQRVHKCSADDPRIHVRKILVAKVIFRRILGKEEGA